MYCAFAPGGSMDLATRAISGAAEKLLGKPVMVENKGGGGTVALALLANAKPDGYTLCYAPNAGIIRAPQFHKITYKPLKRFTPLVAYAIPYNGIVTRPDAPWKTFKELIDYAKKNPNKIKCRTGGPGTAMHHPMAFVEHQEKIKWIHVPYKGNADALTPCLDGHVDVASPEYVPHTRAGQVRILAITEEKRNPKFPDAPTLKKMGYQFANETLSSVVGPAGMSADVVRVLESTFAKAAQTDEVKSALNKLDLVPTLVVGKEYEERLNSLWFRLENNLKDTGLIKEPATSPY